MYNYFITIAYNGSGYKGFQVQKNAITVSEVVQDAIESLFGERYDIKGCSRTDSGVHANCFCISMLCPKFIDTNAVVRALNVKLPSDVAALSCSLKDLDFHARYNCIGKRYLYKIHNSSIRNPFGDKLMLEYKYHIDEKLLHKAAQAFVGKHDFSAFCSVGSSVNDFVRTIFKAEVYREGDMVYFAVEGDGFLYNMVRIMVGTLLEVAQGKIKAEEISDIILLKDRAKAGKTAPAHGLYLDKVYYE